MKIEEQVISHAQVEKGFVLENDPYSIGSLCFGKGRVNTFLSNPNLQDKNVPLIVFERVDGMIMGREMYFPTKMKNGDHVIPSFASSSLFVTEEGRKYMLGASLIMYQIHNMENTVLLYGGMTQMAVDLYKKLSFVVFDVPTLWQIRNANPILQYYRFKGALLSISNMICNVFLGFFHSICRVVYCISNKRFEVVKLMETPDWVEKIIKDDGHKYSEYHSKEWFNWVINNNFYGKKNDTQGLYGIYQKGTPLGFVLITEREGTNTERKINKINYGTIREWGTVDESILSEFQIYRIALALFSQKVDIVSISTLDCKVKNKLYKYGFLNHGSYNIAFRPVGMKLDKDSELITNWRIRASYSDTCFY